jgi:uncharacterized protein YjbI with pentapeptide repeats
VNEADPKAIWKLAAAADDISRRSTSTSVLSRWALAAAVGGILAFTGIAIMTLWWVGGRDLSGRDLVSAHFDAVKIGLSVGIGGGGVVALYLNWRRQRSNEADLDNRERTLLHQQQVAAENREHQNRVASDVRMDAAARRITELFTKAAEQLGSDSLPVRLAAFYALERLGQENETQRASVRKLFCAYLRMPFDASASDGIRDGGDRSEEDYRQALQEREIRLSVQQILMDHLNPDDLEKFWPGQDLDLDRATLIDFEISNLNVGSVSFKNTRFVGDTSFVCTLFASLAVFAGAHFEGKANFQGAKFVGGASFVDATFCGSTDFDKAEFLAEVDFDRAKFEGTTFLRSEFYGVARFRSVFESMVVFGKGYHGQPAVFSADAHFEHAWTGVRFCAAVDFTGVKFALPASFRGATFVQMPNFVDAENYFDVPELVRRRSLRGVQH